MSNRIKNKNRAHEHGNVLFLILIAAALFAALSYVIINSSRTGGGDATREKGRLQAAEILNYTTAVQTAVSRILINGCPLAAISFENPFDGGLHVNGNAPPDKKCHVFEPAGGGVAPKAARDTWANDPVIDYAGSAAITGLGTTCTGADCADLVMVIHDMNASVCEQLNASNGDVIAISNLPVDTQKACPYEGTFDCGGDGNVEVVFAAPALRGKSSICYNDSVHGLTYMHSLLER